MKIRDFIEIPERFTFYSLFRIIIFYIIYLIPLFILLKNKIDSKYYFPTVIIVLIVLELVNLIIKKSFDIHHILLGLYGACLVKYMCKEVKCICRLLNS